MNVDNVMDLMAKLLLTKILKPFYGTLILKVDGTKITYIKQEQGFKTIEEVKANK